MILYLIQLNYCVAKYIRFFFLLEETSSVKGRNVSPGKYLINLLNAVSLQKEQNSFFFNYF